MNIAYLVDEIPNLGGSTPYLRARHLSEKNELFLFLRKNSQIPAEIQSKVTIIRTGFTSGFWHIPWRLYRVWSMGKRVHFDFVYTYHSPFSIVEGFLLKLLGFRWVADVWDLPEQILEAGEKILWRRLAVKASVSLARRFLKHADLVICAIIPDALQNYNIAPGKMLAVTNGVELDCVKPKESKKNGDKFNIFYVGPVHWVRGVDILLEAVDRVSGEIPVKLTLAGRVYDDFRSWLNEFIAEHNLDGVVEILGEIEFERVVNLMEKADVCVCPLADIKTRRYAYPIKVLQYLAMGKPVVATKTPGVAHFIKHGENGLLVSPDDPEGFAEAILRIYRDIELREKLERNARPSVLQYDWGLINEKIDSALSTLLTS